MDLLLWRQLRVRRPRLQAMTISPARYSFSVEEWHQMGEAGLFRENPRVELLDGEVIQMSAIGNRHLACVNRLTRLLVNAVGDQAIVSVQNPVRLDDYSEPQPDVVLLLPRRDFYSSATPGAKDTVLLVEVSDTSLSWDRDRKAPRYAAAGIPTVWIVNLAAGAVLVRSGPAPDGYSDLRRAERGEILDVPGLPGVRVDVDHMLDPD